MKYLAYVDRIKSDKRPEVFKEELRSGLLNTELSQLTRDEELHLEKEFEGYDKLYPSR